VRFPFPGVAPGASEPITETATNWARLIAASPQACNDYMSQSACEQIKCQRVGGKPIPDCTPARWAAEHRGATVQRIAISGDRAAATLTSPEGLEFNTLQLRRTATGEWLIDRLGPIGAVGSTN
jgi:hypothetical protein